MPLPKNATLETVFHSLSKPLDYIPAVFGHLNKVHKVDPTAVVRIGVEGDGKVPNYRIESAGMVSAGPFNGQTHDLLAAGKAQVRTWSEQAVPFKVVEALLRQVREGGK